MYGAVGDETVMLCHEDLWHNGVNETLPDISEYLEKTRALLLANKPAEARDIMTNALKDSGYKGQMASPFP